MKILTKTSCMVFIMTNNYRQVKQECTRYKVKMVKPLTFEQQDTAIQAILFERRSVIYIYSFRNELYRLNKSLLMTFQMRSKRLKNL